MNRDFIYCRLSGVIADQIKRGVLKEGDKLPSVRMLCQQYNIGMNTAKRVFTELEAQSLIISRPQSGYFVARKSFRSLPLPEISKPSTVAAIRQPDDLSGRVYASMGREDLTLFSIAAPSGELLPLAQLKKEMVQATRILRDGGTGYESPQGNLHLRQMVAARSMIWGGNLHEDDLVTTSGGMEALAFSMMVLGKPGDTIAVESPCYPGILHAALSMGFRVLELPTHPVTGIEIDALKKLLPKINICLLIPNFNTPLGSCMPDENKKEVVRLLAEHNIPLIEDDVYGEIYFGHQRPICCKSFDTEGNVIWCSSVSKNLAPGYRVGWIAPGKYKEKILKLKLAHTISSTSIMHEAVAGFLRSGKYEAHLRNYRRTLQNNCLQYEQAIAEYFPPGTKTTKPQGGLTLWVEMNKDIDTTELYELAMRQRISIAPGRMFTLQNQFSNCMRLCIGLPWNEQLKMTLKTLGKLAASDYVKV